MNRCDIPLTEEQREFAAEHLDVVSGFMRYWRLNDDLWDVIIFGYLDAVRDFCGFCTIQTDDSFNAIAWTRMKWRYYNHLKKKKLDVLSMDACLGEKNDLTYENVVSYNNYDDGYGLIELKDALSRLNKAQYQVAILRIYGLSESHIGKILGISERAVSLKLGRIRKKLADFKPCSLPATQAEMLRKRRERFYRAHEEECRERARERARKYREAHLEEYRARDREYYSRKKIEKEKLAEPIAAAQ